VTGNAHRCRLRVTEEVLCEILTAMLDRRSSSWDTTRWSSRSLTGLVASFGTAGVIQIIREASIGMQP
jgi:hypothetical protein